MSLETGAARIIALMGPTAAGKTALACALSEHLPVQLISVDSALIYRGMDIGTGKPKADELRRYPHALIDICDPAEAYSAARFVSDAKCEIDQALAAGKVPVLVGGTMLYFRALLQGLAELPESDPLQRLALESELTERGLPALHAELARVDPAAAARIHLNDRQRILRALEVYRRTGQALSELQTQNVGALAEPVFTIAVQPLQRQDLHERIADRFDAMLAAGFLDEVRALMTRADLHTELPSIRCVGYRQAWAHLAGEISYAEMREQAINATRGLAKRQYTWLRDWPKHILLPDAGPDSLDLLLKALNEQPYLSARLNA